MTCVRLPEVGPHEPLRPGEGVVEVLLGRVVLQQCIVRSHEVNDRSHKVTPGHLVARPPVVLPNE